MRYVLRADASQTIGAGHVMRSSAIAEELIARGKEVLFVGKISNLPWVENRISGLGFTEIHSEPATLDLKKGSDVLILDSYEIEPSDQFIAPENWLKIIAIVDEQTPNFSCDLRIHPGLDISWLSNSTVPIIGGPKYIPLRSSLSHSLPKIKENHDSVRIAVVAGGSDPHRLVLELAKILFTFSEDFKALLFTNHSLGDSLDSRFQYTEIGSHLDGLTQNVDLVLTTASTSSLEFIARGLCVAVVCTFDNQEQYYRSLGEIGAAAQIGIRNSDDEWDLDKEKIHFLIKSEQKRRALIEAASGLIDFHGAKRIVDVITTV